MGKNKKGQRAPQRPATGVMDAVIAVVSAVLLVGLRTFAGPCVHEDGSAAGCTMTGHVLVGLAVLALVLCVMRLLAADLRTRRSFDLLVFVCGLLVALLPGNALSLCMMATMRCHTVMLPFARVMGVALMLISLACELTVDRDAPTGRKKRR